MAVAKVGAVLYWLEAFSLASPSYHRPGGFVKNLTRMRITIDAIGENPI
jgi:hypothetical protein